MSRSVQCALFAALLLLLLVPPSAWADGWVAPQPAGTRLSGVVTLDVNLPSAPQVVFDGYYATDPNNNGTIAWRRLGTATKSATGHWIFDWDTRSVPDQGNAGLGVVNIVAIPVINGQLSDTRYYNGYFTIANTWSASLVAKAPTTTVESGDIATTWLDVRNNGSATWDNAFVHLGTANPHDRISSFFNPATWVSGTRPAALDQKTVLSGGQGRFTVTVKAPNVTSRSDFKEYVEPVADGYSWMADYRGWQNVSMDFTVLPPEPPSVSITSVPSRIQVGDPLEITAQAQDNFSVESVTANVDGGPTTVLALDSDGNYGTSMPSSGLSVGTHKLAVIAADKGGRTSTTTAVFDVVAAPSAISSPDLSVPAPVTAFPPATPPAPPAVKPTQTKLRRFTPIFVTRTSGAHGRSLGMVLGVVRVLGARPGSSLRVHCVRGCHQGLDVRRSLTAHHPGVDFRLPVSTRTVLRLVVRNAPGATRSQDYRFVLRRGALFAKSV